MQLDTKKYSQSKKYGGFQSVIGKEKCKMLKEIRKEIAKENDIEMVIEECTHQGRCKGTCPKCEAEVAYLEEQLEKRKRLHVLSPI